jgi:hypothetical protein
MQKLIAFGLLFVGVSIALPAPPPAVPEISPASGMNAFTGSYRYRVDEVSVVGPENTSALNPTGGKTLTLITCFPFHYIGPVCQTLERPGTCAVSPLRPRFFAGCVHVDQPDQRMHTAASSSQTTAVYKDERGEPVKSDPLATAVWQRYARSARTARSLSVRCRLESPDCAKSSIRRSAASAIPSSNCRPAFAHRQRWPRHGPIHR